MAIIVSTIVSEDGVVGLNGKQYLLDEENNLMYFDTIEDAREFIEDAGADPDDEYIEYEEEKETK